LIYVIDYKNSEPDWRIFAMEHVERDIIGKAVEYSRNMPQTTTEDIVQELRMKVWSSLDNYDKERASLRTFVNRMLKNHLINMTIYHHRIKRNYVCPDNDIFSTDTENEVESID